MPDYRLNSRSPYYIDGEITVTEVVPPPPVEENTPPTVTITSSNDSPYVEETITLTAVATDSDGTVVSYSWNTGETSTSVDKSSNAEGCIDFYVEVTDDDGDTAVATKRICWKKVPEIITNPSVVEVYCGETFGEGQFTGEMVYSIVDVGDKIGDIVISFPDPPVTSYDNYNVPVNFSLEWNGLSASTGYVGNSEYDSDLLSAGVELTDIVTLSTTTKIHPTSLTLTKTTATPTEVLIRATTPLINDQFELTINCPDPTDLLIQTFWYTLEGDDPSGNTTFSYTDTDGNTQTEILADGANEVVCAQENSVSVTSGIGVITKGGPCFDNGTPPQTYDENTELIIIFDDSGSMKATLQPLIDMANGILKDTLVKYYNNSVSEYEKKVKVYKESEFYRQHPTPNNIYGPAERFLKAASFGKINPDATKSIFLFFQDETYKTYQFDGVGPNDSDYTSTFRSPGNPGPYQADLNEYRALLDSANYGEYFMRFFPINYGVDFITQFFRNIFSGENGFDGNKGLSDRSETSIEPTLLKNGVAYSEDKNYYHDFIIKALRDYGFNI